MKKLALAMAVLAGLSLSACSSNNQQQNGNAYKGQVLFSQYQGENLELTIRKNNCSFKPGGELEQVVVPYDSTLVVGACVKVSDDGKGVKNISTWSPRNPI